ncbi:MAG: hypothetical protein HPY83_02690 [Anaerolineae bacterium]|nr:hypothetical protein [Anaerolineae bacterium]
MAIVTAQLSIYPLRQDTIAPAIREAVNVLRQQGLNVRVGQMSTLVWGEGHLVFRGLEGAFVKAMQHGDTVMTVTLSNACEVPEEP